MDITIYTVDGCPSCLILKKYLDSLNFPYEEKDARTFSDYLLSHGFFSAPVLEVSGKLYPFINTKQVQNLLGEALSKEDPFIS